MGQASSKPTNSDDEGNSGNVLSCLSCFDTLSSMNAYLDDSANERKQRLDQLKEGDKFSRTAMLGLTLQELHVKLSEDTSKLEWKTVNNKWTSDEFGEISLTNEVKIIKIIGKLGLQIISSKDDKVLFELHAPSTEIRDKWIISINELLQFWTDNPNEKPKDTSSAKGFSNKNAYFKKREEEIQMKEKENAEKKAKYSTGGLKYTAQIMASRA